MSKKNRGNGNFSNHPVGRFYGVVERVSKVGGSGIFFDDTGDAIEFEFFKHTVGTPMKKILVGQGVVFDAYVRLSDRACIATNLLSGVQPPKVGFIRRMKARFINKKLRSTRIE